MGGERKRGRENAREGERERKREGERDRLRERERGWREECKLCGNWDI